MRILHIITRLILGGAQQNTVLSCAAQVKAGHEVHLAYGPIYGPEGSLLDEATASGAVLHEIGSMRRAVNPWHDVRCYYALRKLIRTIKPDIVHTHSSKAGIVGRAAAWAERNRRFPIVVHTVHGLPFHDRQSLPAHRLYVCLERWAARRCDHLIAITPAMVDAFERKGIATRDRFTVIHSGVDLSCFSENLDAIPQVLEELGIPRGANVLGIVARLDPLKGHRDLMEINGQLSQRIDNFWMLWIGDGFDQSIRDAATKQSNIVMTGLKSHAEVSRLLSAVDVKVLPSYQAGQSRTLIEALLCGCGIVAYDSGGIGSICIDGETGKLVPRGDKKALAEAIIWMFEHPDERRLMVARGQKLVREKFSADTMVAQLEKLYERLVSGK